MFPDSTVSAEYKSTRIKSTNICKSFEKTTQDELHAEEFPHRLKVEQGAENKKTTLLLFLKAHF